MRGGVGVCCFGDSLDGGAAGEDVHVYAVGEEVAVAEERGGVGVDEGEDDAGAGADFDDERGGVGRGEVGLEEVCF